MEKTNTIVILGATASGKTSKAVALAKAINGEIISADSRQIYRGMDIGTGKDIDEYGDINHYLIDICDAGYKYNLYEYLRDYSIAYQQIVEKDKTPILCGGTGLYIESVLKGIQLPEVPENKELRDSLKTKSLDELTTILSSMKSLHNSTDVDTAKRAIRAIEIQQFYHNNPSKKAMTSPQPVKDAVIIGLLIDREARRFKITQRLNKRLNEGMIDEVRSLIEDKHIAPEDLIYYGLEYKFITQYVIGELTYEQMFDGLEIAIHQFAKRQMTWFRGMERRGFKINWLPYDLSNEDFVKKVLSL
ncbi:MAG: tRNA (adenosine(37)-N6)-dimethylallyltransferase MiaA [Muribaculaceae bacterium]|nr:tRNA (adenosine(37)-N6)-dimethylallyltransferase MiaA [Muribaculaceae bacterium]